MRSFIKEVLKMISSAELLNTAIRSARIAGTIINKRIDTSKDVSYKGTVDLVTDVDKLCERNIINIINKSFPTHSILSEEIGGITKSSNYKWIIDPIDGTTNFFHSYPFVSVSIAIEYKEEIIVGVVYDPIKKELFHAIKGKGAFINDRKLHVSNVKIIENALLSTGFPYDIRTSSENNIDNWVKFIRKAQAVRRDGSAALDLCYVAAGRFDGFWEIKLKPWDVAAGFLMIQEAGGIVTDFKGGPYSIYNDHIVASNPHIHSILLGVLNG